MARPLPSKSESPSDEYPLHEGNTTPLTATPTQRSFKIEGSFETEEVPSLFETPARYFRVGLASGSSFAAMTENSADFEARLTLMTYDGPPVAKSEYLMKQFQSAAAGESYWDSALVYNSVAGGEFILKVEPYCSEIREPALGLDGYYCETGDAIIRALTRRG